MIFQESYIYAGIILKTHGYQGHLLIHFEDITFGRLKEKEPIFLEIDGIYVPFFINSFEWKDDKTALIKFDNLSSNINTEEFIGLRIFFSEKVKKGGKREYSDKEIIGFSFHDINTGTNGFVIDIYDIPENPVLKIKTSLNKEFLVPYNNNLIKKISQKEKLLVMKIPEGLI